MVMPKAGADLPITTLLKAIEQTADHVMITDVNGVIVYVNKAFERTTGYLKEEVVGENPRILKSGQQGIDYYQDLWKTILSGQVFAAVTINRKKDQSLYYADQSISPVFDASSRITHFVSVWKDATVRVLKQEDLQRLSNTDSITGIFNHRHFLTTLEYEINRAKRYGADLSLLMIDVDNFKQYNDTLGHLEGDRLLKDIALTVGLVIRNVDIFCRYAGDEFALILPQTGLMNATVVAKKIQVGISKIVSKLPVSISIGVAQYLSGMDKFELIKKSDDNLYAAKHEGKNAICNSIKKEMW